MLYTISPTVSGSAAASTSPPNDTETRMIAMPVVEDPKKVIFILTFTIEKIVTTVLNKSSTELAIQVSIALNPKLQQTNDASPPNPSVFTFDQGGVCQVVVITPEGYSLNGKITSVTVSPGNGQFNGNNQNFLFDMIIGKDGDQLGDIEGLYELIDPNNPSN